MKQAAVNVLVGVGVGVVLANAYLAWSVQQVAVELKQVKQTAEQAKQLSEQANQSYESTQQAIARVAAETTAVKRSTAEVKKEVAKVKQTLTYHIKQTIQLTPADFECLARNIYYEAGVETAEGRLAVAQVTVNRWKSKTWGNNLCQTVYAPGQFSWTSDRSKRWTRPKGPLWEASIDTARQFTRQGLRVRGVEDSHYYHADWVRKPKWAHEMAVAEQIGQHVFYR